MAGLPVLAVALVTFPAHNEFTGLPPIQAGQVFWADSDELPGLVATGQATVAPPGTPYPRPLPYTVRGQPGFGRGAANSSP